MSFDHEKPLTCLAVAINETIADLIATGYKNPEPFLITVLSYAKLAFLDKLPKEEQPATLQFLDDLLEVVRQRDEQRINEQIREVNR